MAHQESTKVLSKNFFQFETTQADDEELLRDIKWLWPHEKIITTTKITENPLYVIPFDHRILSKENLSSQLYFYRFYYKGEMVFYKEIYRDGKEIIDFCTPLAFVSDFKLQDK